MLSRMCYGELIRKIPIIFVGEKKMESNSKTNPSNPTWCEIAACVLIGATFVCAYYGLILWVIGWGLSAVTMGMLAMSESIRLAKRSEE